MYRSRIFNSGFLVNMRLEDWIFLGLKNSKPEEFSKLRPKRNLFFLDSTSQIRHIKSKRKLFLIAQIEILSHLTNVSKFKNATKIFIISLVPSKKSSKISQSSLVVLKIFWIKIARHYEKWLQDILDKCPSKYTQ